MRERIIASFTRDNLETATRIIVPVLSIGVSVWLGKTLMDQMNPNAGQRKEARKQVMKMLSDMGLKPLPKLTEYEVSIATSLVDHKTLQTTWECVGGLTDIITDLHTSVILPFTVAHLVPETGLPLFRAPKGVLFHGPPGCGKTLVARAMAHAAKCTFLNLQVHSLVNMWYGETQKLANAVFSLASKLQPAIIFIDEIDSFLSERSSLDNEATRMMKTQFMILWDGLLSSNDRIMIVAATNRPTDLDAAILRRLPYKVPNPSLNWPQQ
ncbi:hypothetical protein Ciccas_004655 [Cichlidogyrus casuarinus]|uniref:AAA+ ATPase domain-containing protein n=1 Tax=Cichlidogyrus casuarinus TaxID=1844966 RepID=A0ABD2QAU3_9PLAT